MRYCAFLIVLVTLPWSTALGQMTYQRLLESDREPHNWVTYSGSYNGQRYSQLEQINVKNVQKLEFKWAFQMRTLEAVSYTHLTLPTKA